jgi:uncharacterized protein YndB with AHSA1/START domain
MLPIQIERMIALPRASVWWAWTTVEGLTSWLCLRAVVDPVVGGKYELFWNPDESRPESDSTLGCRVLSIFRPRHLHFTWRGSDEVASVMNVPGAPQTEVAVDLFPALEGTRLLVTHQGWGEGPDWARARAWFERAWTAALEKLPDAAARADQVRLVRN